MKKIGTITIAGQAHQLQEAYYPNNLTAIVIDEGRWGKLTVNVVDVPPPPPGHVYVKTWEENARVRAPALATGLFRDTGARVPCGFAMAELWSYTPPVQSNDRQASQGDDQLREALRDALSITLGQAMDCTRVWTAWQAGTMTEDDFQLLADNDERLDELTDAVLEQLAKHANQPAPTVPAGDALDEAAIIALAKEHGFTFTRPMSSGPELFAGNAAHHNRFIGFVQAATALAHQPAQEQAEPTTPETDGQDRRALELANAALIASEPKFPEGWDRHERAIHLTSCALNKPAAQQEPVAAPQQAAALKPAHGHRDDYYLLANGRRLGLEPISRVRSMPNWVLAMELFATGSTSAHQLCRDAGVDPYSTTTQRAAQVDGDQEVPKPCDPAIHEQGAVVAIMNGGMKAMEGLVAEANRRAPGMDWHYFGGRAVVKTLGDVGPARLALERALPVFLDRPAAPTNLAARVPPATEFDHSEGGHHD